MSVVAVQNLQANHNITSEMESVRRAYSTLGIEDLPEITQTTLITSLYWQVNLG